MMNDEKLYNNIKEAARNAEKREFPAMDKVWDRVNDKLDNNVLQRQSNRWKKFAAAASVLLVGSLGFILTDREPEADKIENQIVITDTIQEIPTEIQTPAVVEEVHPAIKNDAPAILEKQIAPPSAVAVESEVITEPAHLADEPIITESQITIKKAPKAVLLNKPNVATRTVRQAVVSTQSTISPQATEANPLLVVDGKAIPEGKEYEKSLDQALQREANGDQEIVILKEPLYIINGAYYSEEEMFGKTPTSPYAPLNKQDIETLTILQGEKAISIYGEKGRNGVVLITTKGGKPAAAKGR